MVCFINKLPGLSQTVNKLSAQLHNKITRVSLNFFPRTVVKKSCKFQMIQTMVLLTDNSNCCMTYLETVVEIHIYVHVHLCMWHNNKNHQSKYHRMCRLDTSFAGLIMSLFHGKQADCITEKLCNQLV